MGPCCVEGCEVTSEETFYFEFPTSRILRRKWLELIPIQGKLPLGTVVCSLHFHAEDYENVRGKVRLKRKVVPSLLLEQQQPSQLLEQQQPSQLLEQQQPSQLPEQQPSQLLQQQQPSQLLEQQQPSQLLQQQQSSLLLEQQQQKPTPISEIPLPKSPPPSPTAPSSPKSPKSPLSPHSPPKELDAGDSTTVSVPSPVDAEKMIDDIQKRIAGSINMLMKTQNGVIGEDQTVGTSPPTAPLVPPLDHIELDHKQDIEDMITNYHIKNKVPNPALLADLVSPAPLAQLVAQAGFTVPVEFEVPQKEEPIVIEDVKEAEPVFIEVSVDKDSSTAGAGGGDCLMVLESVQVDVDPSTLLLAHDEDYYREEERKAHKKEDPISLLTSSDEDDVILQEPHIDTVEVSDETDEDDMPLVKLVKKKPALIKKKVLKKKTKLKKPKPKQDIEEIVWGLYDFYCVQCHFATKNIADYNKHISEHSTVLHVCPICNYTSASNSMFARHTRIHKVEKKFKCHMCDYRARHKMSLIYHLKKHNCDILKSKDFKCKRCSFKSDNKYKVLEHLSSCRESDKKHVCGKCDYASKKKSDLKRHCLRIHPDNCEQFMIK